MKEDNIFLPDIETVALPNMSFTAYCVRLNPSVRLRKQRNRYTPLSFLEWGLFRDDNKKS